MSMLRQVVGWIDDLNDRLGAVARWMVLVMVVIGAGSAVARYLSRGLELTLNLTPTSEAQWYLFSGIFLLGAAYALRHDAHVRVDVLYERLGTRARGWIDLVGTVAFLVPLAILMLWVAFPAVRASWEIRETSPDPGGLPRYPVKALILVSFGLLLLQALSQVVKHVDAIRGVTAADPAPPEPEGHA